MESKTTMIILFDYTSVRLPTKWTIAFPLIHPLNEVLSSFLQILYLLLGQVALPALSDCPDKVSLGH